MKAVNNLIALALMAAFSTQSMAASIDVKVIGTIAPVACTPTLSGGGTVDYGKISTSLLSSTTYSLLEEKKIDFAITCEAPVKMAVKAINGRPTTIAGAVEGASGFGNAPVSGFFGTTTSGTTSVAGLGLASEKKIGGYALRIDPTSVTTDEAKADLITSTSNNAWTKSTLGSLVSTASTIQTTWAKVGTATPVAFTTMSGKLGVQAYINKLSELDLTADITLDGLTTLELVYL